MRLVDGDHLRLTLLGWRQVAVENGNDGAAMMINLFLSALDHEPTIEKSVLSSMYGTTVDARMALDKQEPKEPVMRNGYYSCPTCDADEFFLMYDDNMHDRYDYCANCGQKLKWEGLVNG